MSAHACFTPRKVDMPGFQYAKISTIRKFPAM